MANTLSDEILKFLMDNAESMISIINTDMKYENVNESFCKQFNKQKEDLIGLSPSDIWGEKTYREKIRQNIERSLRGEEVQYRASFDITGGGSRFYEVTYRPFRSDRTNLSYAIVETRDINVNQAEKEKTRGKDMRYHFIENYLPFGVFSCTREGLITDANDTFYNILEIKEHNRVKTTFRDFITGDLRFSDFLATGNPGESGTFGQLQMTTAGKKDIFARISSHIREDSKHRIIIDGTLEEITREVLLERRLYHSHRLETLGTLAGGVAHDFNTILTTISGYSEMTMDEVDKDSAVYDYMIKLKAAVSKAENIIKQMLVFSKQMDQHVISLEVEKVLKEAVDFIRSSVPPDIRLVTGFEKINGLVRADPTQLFRVFLNIMTNALHAMEEKGGILGVYLSSSGTDDRWYADIRVEDTGTGIDRSIIDRIFEPFFTTKDLGKGTGMGLAVSHGIITEIGGEINVESCQGKGTALTVRIPLYDIHARAGSGTEAVPGNIVFAHDNLHLSRTVSLALERMGYTVSLVSSKSDLENTAGTLLAESDIIFVIDKFIDDNVRGLLHSLIKDGKPGKAVLIRGNDGHEPYEPDVTATNEFDVINEPLTLKDILSQVNI